MLRQPDALDNLQNKLTQYVDSLDGFHDAIENCIAYPGELDTDTIYREMVKWVRRVKKQYHQFQDAKQVYEIGSTRQ